MTTAAGQLILETQRPRLGVRRGLTNENFWWGLRALPVLQIVENDIFLYVYAPWWNSQTDTFLLVLFYLQFKTFCGFVQDCNTKNRFTFVTSYHSSSAVSSCCFVYPITAGARRPRHFHQIRPANDSPTTSRVTNTATAMAHPLGPCFSGSFVGNGVGPVKRSYECC